VNDINRLFPDADLSPDVIAEGSPPEVSPAPESPPVDPVRSAAGRLGGKRVHTLAVLGREYEKEHGLSPGRERLKHLIKLGKRYEAEHGLRIAKPRRRKVEAWPEFLAALARVVKPAYRPMVEELAASLSSPVHSEPCNEQAA
jgi:hypothetical protein